MTIFNVDLDNTLIYSYKHDIGNPKMCAEVYQEREISFMSNKTRELLVQLFKIKEILIVPTTTRTVEQYQRVRLGVEEIPYALVCNGGVLLIDGKEDKEWYVESLKTIEAAKEELKKAELLLVNDSYRCFEVRNIKELFLFTKSSQPKDTIKSLSNCLNPALVDVFDNGMKVYAVPKNLSKGAAARRLKEKMGAQRIIAAGDSGFDVSMLECADLSIAPEKLEFYPREGGKAVKISGDRLFSEGMLEYIVNHAAGILKNGNPISPY